ncbi:hypothetical protein [Methanosphaera sp.]|uniref:hypothetical protein n=1 Tax=Methanosphaera sp. TaxID=2666342 RepID=UPI002A80BF4F|nr:hypothetical protein [Methanosphaera sp.]
MKLTVFVGIFLFVLNVWLSTVIVMFSFSLSESISIGEQYVFCIYAFGVSIMLFNTTFLSVILLFE